MQHARVVCFETPRVLNEEQIAAIAEDFANVSANSKAAGFDGVETHRANGYLVDQFLRDGSKKRADRYGGPVENRARFLLETADAVLKVWSADRVGVRLSPFGQDDDIHDSESFAVWRRAVRELGKRGIAYIHVVEPRADKSSDTNALDPNAPDAAAELGAIFRGPLISAGGYVGDTARAATLSGKAAAVAFGRLFIANPDLVKRFHLNASLNPYDRSTFYGGTAVGYVAYPILEDLEGAAA